MIKRLWTAFAEGLRRELTPLTYNERDKIKAYMAELHDQQKRAYEEIREQKRDEKCNKPL
jgi:hypothetical protein